MTKWNENRKNCAHFPQLFYCLWHFILQTLPQLKRKMESSLFSTVHVGFNTVRFAEIYNDRTHKPGQEKKSVSHISVVDTGDQMTISGSGEIFEFFQQTGLLQKFSGYGEKPVTFFELGFKTASIRKMNLDETYYNMHYDIRHSEKFLISTLICPSC